MLDFTQVSWTGPLSHRLSSRNSTCWTWGQESLKLIPRPVRFDRLIYSLRSNQGQTGDEEGLTSSINPGEETIVDVDVPGRDMVGSCRVELSVSREENGQSPDKNFQCLSRPPTHPLRRSFTSPQLRGLTLGVYLPGRRVSETLRRLQERLNPGVEDFVSRTTV